MNEFWAFLFGSFAEVIPGLYFHFELLVFNVSLNVPSSWIQKECRMFKALQRWQGIHSGHSRKPFRLSCRTFLISSQALILHMHMGSGAGRPPSSHWPGAGGEMWSLHWLPASAGTEINESRGPLVTEEDKMSLCGMGSQSLANSLGSAAAVPVYVCVLMGVCVFAAFDWVVCQQRESDIWKWTFWSETKVYRKILNFTIKLISK